MVAPISRNRAVVTTVQEPRALDGVHVDAAC